MSSLKQQEALINQLAAQYNLNPSKNLMLSPFGNFPMTPNQDFLKVLYANHSFSALQAHYSLFNNPQESENFLKTPSPLVPPNLSHFGFGINKPPFPFDMLSKFEGLGNPVNQNISPASGMPNIFKERLASMMPPFMGNFGRVGSQEETEQANFNDRNRALGRQFPTNFTNRPKLQNEKEVITVSDEDEVVECKPEEFKKILDKTKENKETSKFLTKQNNLNAPNKNRLIQRRTESKVQNKKPIISLDDSGPTDDTKFRFFSNNSLIKRNYFKKKTKKGFLSHRKKHRNQKRREKIVYNCKKCNSRIVILTKKVQFPDYKFKDRLCKNCLSETQEKEYLVFSQTLNEMIFTIESQEKKSNTLINLSHRYMNHQSKTKEEDSESKSDTISRYKEMMFANSNRILLGENYQAAMPEFLLNKPQKINEWRTKTMEQLNANKIWNPNQENSKLYDDVFQLICTTFNSTYSHYEFVAMIDQYEGDLKLIREKIEMKDVGIVNAINEAISNSGKKRITRSSKNKFRRHDLI